MSYGVVDKQMRKENQHDFRAFCDSSATQTLRSTEREYKSYFAALRSWKTDPSKFTAKPEPPSYKNKKTGRYVTMFTVSGISSLKKTAGFIKLSQIDFRIPNSFKTSEKNENGEYIYKPIDKINQVRIVPKKDKTYVIEIVYEVEAEKIEATDNYAGIDIGLNNLAT
ncbi:MAG: hypothetical protein ACRDBG_06125, partial [Waterburya sp.]